MLVSWLIALGLLAYFLAWIVKDKEKVLEREKRKAATTVLPKSRLQNYVRLTQKRPKEDLEGKVAQSEELEKALWTLVEYIIRDYIEWWYLKISPNSAEFPNDVRHLFEHVMSQLVDGLKAMEWEPLIQVSRPSHPSVNGG